MIPESTSGPVYRVPLSRRDTAFCSLDESPLSRDSAANRRSRDSAALSRDSAPANRRSENGTSLVSRARTSSRRSRTKNYSRMGEMRDRCGSLRKENALLEEKVMSLMEELDFLKQMFMKHASGRIAAVSLDEYQRVMSDASPGPDVSALLSDVSPSTGYLSTDLQSCPSSSVSANSESQHPSD